MNEVERSTHYLLVSEMMQWKMGKGVKSKGSVLGFLLFLTTFLIVCQFANYATAESLSSSVSPKPTVIYLHRKRPIPFVPALGQREWRTVSAVNATRNARQVPEIPALYSVPNIIIPTPEVPALYSAPAKVKSADSSDPNEQNDADADPQARQATTEITIGGEDDEEEDETASEDYQYGVPTEKSTMSDDSNQAAEDESLNEYPTNPPMPAATYLPPVSSRTNDEADFNDDEDNAEETTEDTYSAGGYDNDPAKEPSQQYGPPAASKPTPKPTPTTRKNGNGKDSSKRKMQSSSSPSLTNNSNKNNGRPSDQQQKMGKRMQEQPQTQNQKKNGFVSEPPPAYLPPVYLPPSQPTDHQDDIQQEDAKNQQQGQQQQQQQEMQEEQYTPSSYGQQPPNVNYHTLPDMEDDVPQQNDLGMSPYEPNSVDKSANGDNIHSAAQGFSEAERSKGLPDNGQQGQHFGNEQPSTVYGPPGVNHLQSHSNNHDGAAEEELEGLNENIVDAELLERVQQIIEDHERQQKTFLDKVQKDNEKAFGVGGGSSGYSGPSGISSFTNENELHDGFSSRGGGPGGLVPFIVYGPPALATGPSGSGSNGYHNPSSIQQQSNGDHQSGNNLNKPSAVFTPPSLSPPSQNGGGYNNQRQEKNLDFQVQKAVLSRHFTETQITPTHPERKEEGYQNKNKLNDFAGPGTEYLPPAPTTQQQKPQSGNSGYPNSYNSGNGKPEVFNVKVSTGIVVGGKPISTSGSVVNQQPSNSYLPPPPPYSPLQKTLLSSLTSGAARSQNSQGYNGRQAGASNFHTGRFPSELPSYQPSYPQQQPQQRFQPSTFWSRSHPQHGSPPAPPQTRYGPPEHRSGNPTTSYQSNTGSTSNKNSIGNHSVGSSNPTSGDYHQRSYNSQQSPSQQQHSAFQPGGFNINNNGNDVIPAPLPTYGIPLAPVITLETYNNLSNFNSNSNNVGGGNKEKNTFSSYSQDGNNVGQSFPVSTSSGSGSPSNYYLPPRSPSQNGEIGQHTFPVPSTLIFPQQEAASTSTNGNFANNPSSSSSSTYLMIQGHDGNSNNHIYNINHNGYDPSSLSLARLMSSASSISGDVGDDGSSIIIPGGISNTFSLPIYDFTPSNPHRNDELMAAAQNPSQSVVPPIRLILKGSPRSLTSPGSTFSGSSIYGTNAQEIFRVSRRALTRKANVKPVDNNSTKKPLTNMASNSTRKNDKK